MGTVARSQKKPGIMRRLHQVLGTKSDEGQIAALGLDGKKEGGGVIVFEKLISWRGNYTVTFLAA